MAKYTRHDQRNKKRNKHKCESRDGRHSPKVKRVGKNPTGVLAA